VEDVDDEVSVKTPVRSAAKRARRNTMHKSATEISGFIGSRNEVMQETVSITKAEPLPPPRAAAAAAAAEEKEVVLVEQAGSVDLLAPLTLICLTMLMSTLAAALECVWLVTLARMAWIGALGNCVVLFVWILCVVMGHDTTATLISCTATFERNALGIVLSSALGGMRTLSPFMHQSAV